MRFPYLTLSLLFLVYGALSHSPINAQTPPSPDTFPVIPTAALEQYQVSFIEESLESMLMQRLRLSGPRTFIMDTLSGHFPIATQGQCSARLVLRHAPEFIVEFFAFPAASFGQPLDDDSLNAYLQGLSLSYTPEQNFQILEESAFSGIGSAKFRILGQRAHTIRYSYQQGETITVIGENWIEREDTIYIVKVQAPPRSFAKQFEDVRATFNSISEQD